MKTDEKKLELLKKLKALAERGVGGEKEGAQKKLEQLMKKYGIEDANFSEDKEEDHDFRYHDEFEKKILRQLFYKIVPDFQSRTYFYRHGRGSKSTYGIRCTKAQALQIRIEYDFYCELWKEEADFFMSAFIQKHRIFAIPKNKDDIDTTEISKADIMRMLSMMGGMKEKSIQPLLGTKED